MLLCHWEGQSQNSHISSVLLLARKEEKTEHGQPWQSSINSDGVRGGTKELLHPLLLQVMEPEGTRLQHRQLCLTSSGFSS